MKHIAKILFATLSIIVLASCGEDFSDERDKARLDFENYVLNAGIHDSLMKESGVYYIKRIEGDGKIPTSGDEVLIEYTVYSIDSTFAGSNTTVINKTPFPLFDNNYLTSNVIPFGMRGMHEALSYMREGEVATVLVPFEQAFEHREVSGFPRFSSWRIELKLILFYENIPE